MVDLVWAARTAEEHLAPLGRRWEHVRQVAQAAHRIATAIAEDSDTLVAAALFHDIGYSPALVNTGFHPLDGARFVRDAGHPEIAGLVAHHTGARNEAVLRGLPELLEEFPFNDSLLQRALTYCDLTNGPDGQPTRAEERVREIVQRYGEEHVVARAALVGLPEFLEIEAQIEGLIKVRSTG